MSAAAAGDWGGVWRGATTTGIKCVLVVDSDDFESSCIREELKRLNLRDRVHCVSSAAELMAYLNGIEQFGDRDEYPFPALIILTVSLPGVDGVTTVEWLRSSPKFCDLPVIMLGRPVELLGYEAAMNAGAHGWMTKPFNGQDFLRIINENQIPLTFDH
jgi:CheY-like chemotaxis protein